MKSLEGGYSALQELLADVCNLLLNGELFSVTQLPHSLFKARSSFLRIGKLVPQCCELMAEVSLLSNQSLSGNNQFFLVRGISNVIFNLTLIFLL